jgi:hypothetical protein
VSFADRLGEVLRRTLGKVVPEVQAQLARLIDPTTLEIMAGVLAAWVVSHAFGLGEIIDVNFAVGGAVAVGWSVLDGIDEVRVEVRFRATAPLHRSPTTAGPHRRR